MIKKWLLSNLIGVSISVFVLMTTFGLVYSLANKDKISTGPDNVQLRSGPGLQYRSLATLKRGTDLIVLKDDQGWYQVRRADNEKVGWVASWVAKSHTLRHATPMSEATIVLDPGHGGNPNKRYNGLSGDNGSSSADGKYHEKTYTLRTARQVRDALAPTGARVLMTRDSDVLVPLLDIPKLATKYHADAQISFHFDHAGDENSATDATGITQYYYQENGQALTSALHNALNSLPMTDRGMDTAKYVVLNRASQPATLLELGYINNPSDFKKIQSTRYQKQIANAITKGLTTYFDNEAGKK